MTPTTVTPALPVVSRKLARMLCFMALMEAAIVVAFFLL